MKRPTIVIADDHTMLVEAFSRVLEDQFDVIATAENGRELIELVIQHKPDAVVLDISMPLLNGLGACEKLSKLTSAPKIIILTVNEDPDVAAEAFRLGANGYVLKKSAAYELIEALQQALAGRTYITPLVTGSMVDSLLAGPASLAPAKKLTSRQAEVLQLLVEGLSMKEVARVLDLSPRTVAFHKYRIMEEFQLANNSALIQFAIKKGVVSIQS